MNNLRIASLTFAMFLMTWEASAACQAQGGLICGSGAPSLSSPGGLQVSRGGKFRPLDSGVLLRGGDRVLSGANAATLSLGASCSTTVGAGSLVALSRSGGRTCARVSNVQGSPVVQQGAPGAPGAPGIVGAPGLAGPSLTGLGIAAGAAGAVGVGVAVATSGGRRDTPPTVSAQ